MKSMKQNACLRCFLTENEFLWVKTLIWENEMFVFDGKRNCCNNNFTDAHLTLLLVKNI